VTQCKWCPHLPALPTQLHCIATRAEANIRASMPTWLHGSQLEQHVVRWAVYALHEVADARPRQANSDAPQAP
jgi:hypothetical protein